MAKAALDNVSQIEKAEACELACATSEIEAALKKWNN
jgi:hypothetical protein